MNSIEAFDRLTELYRMSWTEGRWREMQVLEDRLRESMTIESEHRRSQIAHAVEAIGKGELLDLVEHTDPETVADAIIARLIEGEGFSYLQLARIAAPAVRAAKDFEDTLRKIQRDMDA